MRKYQVVPIVLRVVVTVLVLACSGSCPCYAQVTEPLPLDNPNAVMQMLLSTLKTMETPLTGRGTAVMKVENIGGDTEGRQLNVDFVFKDQKSRVDVFESDGAGGGLRVRAEAKSDKNSILVGRYDATIQRPELHNNNVGRDFHPETFFKFLGEKSLVEWLEYELEHPRSPADRSVKLDQDGILHLSVRAHIVIPKRAERDGKEYDVEAVIRFDTQRGLRPVFCERKFTNADGSWNAIQTKLQWAKFGSAWYVSAFEYNEPPSNHAHTVGTVTDFAPNVEVSDAEFTLDGMAVPHGMIVFDKIAGVSYRYGVPVSLIEDLEKPLGEADFVQKIRKRQSVTESQGATAIGRQGRADPNQATLDDADSVRTTELGQVRRNSPWGPLIAIGCVAALIGGAAVLRYKSVGKRS